MDNAQWVKTPSGQKVVDAMITCNHEWSDEAATEEEDMTAILLSALETGLLFTSQSTRTGRYG